MPFANDSWDIGLALLRHRRFHRQHLQSGL
jgi:hypothetical protein